MCKPGEHRPLFGRPELPFQGRSFGLLGTTVGQLLDDWSSPVKLGVAFGGARRAGFRQLWGNFIVSATMCLPRAAATTMFGSPPTMPGEALEDVSSGNRQWSAPGVSSHAGFSFGALRLHVSDHSCVRPRFGPCGRVGTTRARCSGRAQPGTGATSTKGHKAPEVGGTTPSRVLSDRVSRATCATCSCEQCPEGARGIC